MKKIAIICLSRFGDILSILPLAEYLSENAYVDFYVAPEFKEIFDVVPYARPILWTGTFADAQKHAFACFDEVIDAQVNHRGTTDVIDVGRRKSRSSINFQETQWKRAGYLGHFNVLPLRLTRDIHGERLAWEKLFPKNSKPSIGLALRGFSSAFNSSRYLKTWINECFGETHNVIDLDAVNLPKIYHLLGPMSKCQVLVGINSAPLHLVYALPQLPVIALHAGYKSDFHRASTRPSWVAEMTYENSIEDEGKEILYNILKDI